MDSPTWTLTLTLTLTLNPHLGQPDINAKLNAVLRKLGMANDDFVTRTTGCPNGCARPYTPRMEP